MASSDATKGSKADLYGQYHPSESPDLISAKLEEFEREIKKLPEEKKVWLLEAEEKCPDLVTDKFKLIFLRSEVFNADVSVSCSKQCSESLFARRLELICSLVFFPSSFFRCFFRVARCQALCQVLGQTSGNFRSREGIFTVDIGCGFER